MDQQTGRERRMSPRISTALNMRVYAYGMLVANGMTVDMSEHGLMLRIEQDFTGDQLDPGKHLDVMLEYEDRIPARHWLPIMVVRNCEAGIAARFLGVDVGAC